MREREREREILKNQRILSLIPPDQNPRSTPTTDTLPNLGRFADDLGKKSPPEKSTKRLNIKISRNKKKESKTSNTTRRSPLSPRRAISSHSGSLTPDADAPVVVLVFCRRVQLGGGCVSHR